MMRFYRLMGVNLGVRFSQGSVSVPGLLVSCWMREHRDRKGNHDRTDYYDTHRVTHECTEDAMERTEGNNE